MSILTLDHKQTLDPVLHPLFLRLVEQQLSTGTLRGLPVLSDGQQMEYVLFDEDATHSWLTSTSEQLKGLLSKSAEAISIDPRLLDAPLMEAIWKIRQGSRAGTPKAKPAKDKASPVKASAVKEPGSPPVQPDAAAAPSGGQASDAAD
ncbi:hypothetical protein [Deinococcus ruber]|uniref:Uncharacterized protein n=1 Tax=Deinococcus ruber TaxID=1848197 RepID=A0A918CBW8_9DEIO|nr:hypothetical protein [Deinococcus ruber]GGR15364.1 hypothetical protein GCM10008957_30130 [Deinococcus ruber]